MADGYVVGRTVRMDHGPFAQREMPYGPGHAVPEGDSFTAVCGVPVDDLLGPWPPRGLGASSPCPACTRALA